MPYRHQRNVMRKNLNNKNGVFTTPEGYFSKLNRDIMEATCNKAENKKRRVIGLPKVTRIIGYAAMIAVIAVVALRFTGNSKSSTDYFASESLNDSEYIENMLTNYHIDDYTFYCYLTGE